MFMGLPALFCWPATGAHSAARTYGWQSAEVFTAVANAVLLIGVAVFHPLRGIRAPGPRAGDTRAWPMTGSWRWRVLIANGAVVCSCGHRSESSLAVKGAYMEVVGRRGGQHRRADRAGVGQVAYPFGPTQTSWSRCFVRTVGAPAGCRAGSRSPRSPIPSPSPQHINTTNCTWHWPPSTGPPRSTILHV